MTVDDRQPSTTPTPSPGSRPSGSRPRGGSSLRSGRAVIGQVADVLADLPVFLTAPLYRRWHLRWGSTDDEVASAMAGDAAFPGAQFVSTRAITIDAEPSAVWPWLVQVGCGRAGFYSNDLLDNLARPSATTIVADLQHLEIGQWIPMSPSSTPNDKTAFRVDSFEIGSWMLWTKPGGCGSWTCSPVAAAPSSGRGGCVTRVRRSPGLPAQASC